jgi:hypothetical protein
MVLCERPLSSMVVPAGHPAAFRDPQTCAVLSARDGGSTQLDGHRPGVKIAALANFANCAVYNGENRRRREKLAAFITVHRLQTARFEVV